MKNQLTHTTFLLLFSSIWLQAQSIELVQFSSGFNQPTDIAHANGSEIYITNRIGEIFSVDGNGTVNSEPFLDITDIVVSNAGERGLLGIAFHPNYPDSSYIYCNYTGTNGATFVSRFDVISNTKADSTSEKIIITFAQPFTNHNGGDIVFDDNGYLMIASGDGGSGGDPQNNGQNKNSLLGKILRIDIDNGDPYAIPPDNPFVGQANVMEEIWAYGLRNPWRIDFDEMNQALYVADVGQNEFEEINEINPSIPDKNMGWRCYEGTSEFNIDDSCEVINHVEPIHEYAHRAGGGCTGSITGGVLYRGSDMPAFYGKYFYADYCTGFVAALDVNTLQNDTLVGPASFRFSTFGEDSQGRLYIAERNSGIIYRFESNLSDFIYTIDLDGTQAGTPSTATGYGIATLDTTTKQLNVSGQFTELIANVTVAHVHRGAAGSTGGVVFPLTITDYGTDSIGFFGSGILTTNQLNDLLTNDGLYVNIHSSAHPSGEIRGQIIGVSCPLTYEIDAPLIPGGLYKVKNANAVGSLENNRSATIKHSESITLKEGFTMSLGATLEIIYEACGP